MPESRRRSLLSEILRPLGLGLLVVVLFLLLLRALQATLGSGIPIAVVPRLLGASLPAILVLAIPISLIFAVLGVAGRLSSSGELASVGSLYRPILLLSAVLTLFSSLLVFFAVPWGAAYLQKLRGPPPRHLAPKIEPQGFYQFGDTMLYVFDRRPEDGRWRGVFMAERPPDSETTVITAEWGRLEAEEGRGFVLKLGNVRIFKTDLENQGTFRVSLVDGVSYPLPHAPTYSEIVRTLRQRTLVEVLRKAADPSLSPRISRALRFEVHRRLALPVVCLVLGFVALPLGLTLRIGPTGRLAASLIVPILVILLYYVTLDFFARAATAGRLAPWLAMWLPNLLLAAAGLALSIRKIRAQGPLLSLVLTFAVLLGGALAAAYLQPYEPSFLQWRVDGNRIYTWDQFDAETNQLFGLQIFDLSEKFFLRDQIFVAAAQFSDGGWSAEDGLQRSFDKSGSHVSVHPLQQTRISLPEPAFFYAGF